ncbi:type II secretion system minor pseudopilin GspK [Variovorax sp. PAMC28562]|uniref:type II secretion system minor pseudopilin GspK n=1 Tax=Variovorax sp. PAMC28562 TaxID=2762323 RepID=UPI00164D745D|nr:type II secretion system minor pseudopilin GspK [Variovorax sp. PAMC28562]QNK75414.1 type II secretion system minor pseudopilin GspK [Variovorax sp. PAMC28562]
MKTRSTSASRHASFSLVRQRGAALLAAMLTVTLVATFAAAALWQQWRATEVEAAERSRVQAAWVLIGALDWSRLILREDARAGGPDSLAEPWAVPLEEARLSSFLADDKNIASDALEGLPDAFLSGRIIDAQSKLNVMNLVSGGKPVPASVAAFSKLFELLGLPAQEVGVLTANLQRAAPATISATAAGANTTQGAAAATAAIATANVAGSTGSAGTTAASGGTASTTGATGTSDPNGPLLPQRTGQLVWLGLSPSTVTAISPYVTILPVGTRLNLNTAAAEALFASVPTLDLAGAKRLVAQRTRTPFKTVADAGTVVPQVAAELKDTEFDVGTRFFEVEGRLRIDRTYVEEHSLLQRDGVEVKLVWRERGAGATAVAGKP